MRMAAKDLSPKILLQNACGGLANMIQVVIDPHPPSCGFQINKPSWPSCELRMWRSWSGQWSSAFSTLLCALTCVFPHRCGSFTPVIQPGGWDPSLPHHNEPETHAQHQSLMTHTAAPCKKLIIAFEISFISRYSQCLTEALHDCCRCGWNTALACLLLNKEWLWGIRLRCYSDCDTLELALLLCV